MIVGADEPAVIVEGRYARLLVKLLEPQSTTTPAPKASAASPTSSRSSVSYARPVTLMPRQMGSRARSREVPTLTPPVTLDDDKLITAQEAAARAKFQSGQSTEAAKDGRLLGRKSEELAN